MKKKIISLVTVCLFVSACSSVDSLKTFDQQQAANFLHQNRTPQPTQQMIKILLPEKSKWKKIDLSFGTIGTPIMLIPQNETLTNWKQSIRTGILSFGHRHQATANQFVQNEILAAKQDCQKVEIEEFLQAAQTVIYRINKVNCYEEKNQLQIGKAFKGHDAIYLVYYTVMTGWSSNAEIEEFSRVIKTARLIPNPKY